MKMNNYEFRSNGAIQSLKETSKNKAGNSYMTDCSKTVIDFDKAKTNYCNELGKSEEYAASADSLCFTHKEGEFFLIEFKDGGFENKEIRKKAKDSAYILSGILGKDVNYIRENVTFVLVYNGEVKKIEILDRIAIAKANRGKEDFAIWGLDHLKGFYYHRILVYEKEQFNKSVILDEIVSVE